ncbi:TPA: M protein [Streptococcus pyogenes]|nr:M protein [Streptococcus pyogenes]VHE64700.1 antiphagocytic M protein, type 3 [Streptococcus pyogenes]
MAKNNTNRHYSLRKLKTGTASVAVALSVLGAGFANQTEVKAQENTDKYDSWVKDREEERAGTLNNDLRQLEGKVRNLRSMMHELWKLQLDSKSKNLPTKDYANYLKELNDHFEKYLDEASGVDYKKLLGKTLLQEKELKDELQKLVEEVNRTSTDLKNKQEEYDIAVQGHALREREHQQFIDSIAKVLEDKEVQRHNLQQSLDTANAELVKKEQELDQKEKELKNEELAKESAISDLTEQITTKKAEVEKLAQDLAAKSAEIQEKEAEKDRQQHMYEAFMSQYKETVEKQEQELAKLKQLETINNNLLGNAKDMIAKLSAKNEQLASDKAKLEEQNKISDASRQGLRRDLNASREAKKQVEKDLANLTAELDKVKEDKQISDASRQGLRRDLDASREAKKQVEKALEEANSKLAALEKLNKELEESKKLTEKEKAELQAKLEAEAKALKEQLAKQAEELAKLRAGKASDSQTPDTKPGNKAVPGKGQAPQAGTKPNQNKAPMKETKRQLPSTGETANPFFTAAALTVMATAGVAAVVKRKEEN